MMKTQPFSVCVDGSNDQDVGKMYPLTVRIYDVNRSSVVSRLLDICSISGSGNSTAQGTAILVQLFVSCRLQD